MSEEQFIELVAIAIGEASTLMTGDRIFDSTHALAIVERIIEAANEQKAARQVKYETEQTKLACVLVNNGKLLSERDQTQIENNKLRDCLKRISAQEITNDRGRFGRITDAAAVLDARKALESE